MSFKLYVNDRCCRIHLFNISFPLHIHQKLLEMAKQPKTTNSYTKAVKETLKFLHDQVFTRHLVPFKAGPPLLELFVFGDLSAIRSHIMGAPRAALHTALHNPQTYLQCDCCVIDNASQMAATLPDLPIVFKLHLECGKMINLFDWMQAFRSIVDAEAASDDEDADISPQIQYPFAKLTFMLYLHFPVALLQIYPYINQSVLSALI